MSYLLTSNQPEPPALLCLFIQLESSVLSPELWYIYMYIYIMVYIYILTKSFISCKCLRSQYCSNSHVELSSCRLASQYLMQVCLQRVVLPRCVIRGAMAHTNNTYTKWKYLVGCQEND